ncbi:MAG: hypothetical protein ACREBG_13355, partial [Pyrinomonadaceae bacterium]
SPRESLHATHDSGPLWLARPLTYDSFIHYNLPVYPGALRRGLGPAGHSPREFGLRPLVRASPLGLGKAGSRAQPQDKEAAYGGAEPAPHIRWQDRSGSSSKAEAASSSKVEAAAVLKPKRQAVLRPKRQQF